MWKKFLMAAKLSEQPVKLIQDIKFKSTYFSIGICVCLTFLYWIRPNWAAALTIFPSWSWLFFWAFVIRSYKTRLFVFASFIWVAFIFMHVEECKSLLRCLSSIQESKNNLKVLTINCSGSIKALKDSFKINPEIVLVQESPSKDQIEKFLNTKKGYQLLYGFDTSIIVRGNIQKAQEKIFYIAGLATIDSKQYYTVSLRLETSNPRLDFWNPACWKAYKEKREQQLEQMRNIKSLIQSDTPTVVGGDFNVPQGDKVFTLIKDRLQDTFIKGGRGWCNTILKDFPVLRIDQIWISKNLSCSYSYAKPSVNTDHRYYVASIGN